MPKGRKSLDIIEPFGSMSKRLLVENFGARPMTVATSATTAMAVIPNISLSASPTPYRCTPMKIT